MAVPIDLTHVAVPITDAHVNAGTACHTGWEVGITVGEPGDGVISVNRRRLPENEAAPAVVEDHPAVTLQLI